MSRLQQALIGGRDTCTGACETHHGCDCVIVRQPAPTTAWRPIPTRRTWFDRWINGMRAAYLRKLIDIGEAHQLQLEAQMRANDADIASLRVQLALVEN